MVSFQSYSTAHISLHYRKQGIHTILRQCMVQGGIQNEKNDTMHGGTDFNLLCLQFKGPSLYSQELAHYVSYDGPTVSIVQWWSYFQGWTNYTHSSLVVPTLLSRLNELCHSSTLVAQICTRFLQICHFLACSVKKFFYILAHIGWWYT